MERQVVTAERLLQRLTVDPKILGGKPTIRGRRLAVEHVLGMLAAGDRPEMILEGYPWLKLEDIQACLVYAHRLVAHERVDLTLGGAADYLNGVNRKSLHQSELRAGILGPAEPSGAVRRRQRDHVWACESISSARETPRIQPSRLPARSTAAASPNQPCAGAQSGLRPSGSGDPSSDKTRRDDPGTSRSRTAPGYRRRKPSARCRG